MQMTRTRKALVTGAAALGVVLGAAGITAAATSSDSSSQPAAESEGAEGSSYTSSITAAEDAKLDGLATITADEASAAAVSDTGGTAGKVELENENGNVVYGVDITQADGTKLDVKVDAGNAKVLAKEADDDRLSENGESGND